jgi:formate-dependent nitrite reductase membrane component NrfD
MSVYTGTLLAATSTPLWASAYKLLPALFGASAASTATAALTLMAPEEEQKPLETLGLVAEVAELALVSATQRTWRAQQVDQALHEEPTAAAFRLGAVGLGIVVPLAVHGVQLLTGRRSRTASTLAAVSTLIGGFCLRAAILRAGNESARRPEDYFQLTGGQRS